MHNAILQTVKYFLNVQIINPEKIKQRIASFPPFVKTFPCTILPPHLFIFSNSLPAGEVIKIYSTPPFSKKTEGGGGGGGPNYDQAISYYVMFLSNTLNWIRKSYFTRNDFRDWAVLEFGVDLHSRISQIFAKLRDLFTTGVCNY